MLNRGYSNGVISSGFYWVAIRFTIHACNPFTCVAGNEQGHENYGRKNFQNLKCKYRD